jgi:long-subunit fatty acid transport protein
MKHAFTGAALCLFLGAAQSARAQSVGTVFSGPTDGDASAPYWNPAAMARSKGTEADVSMGVWFIRLGYTALADGSTSNAFVPRPDPTAGFVTDILGPKWRLGMTFGAPVVNGAIWPRDGGASSITRFYVVEGKTYHLTFTPAISYAPSSRFSIGAGIDIVRSTIDAELDEDMGSLLNTMAGSDKPDSPFPYADPSLAAPVHVNANGWGVGYALGALVRPTDRVTIGVGFHSAVGTTATGSLHFDYPDAVQQLATRALPSANLPSADAIIAVPLTLPLRGSAAIAVEPADRWELRAEYRYVHQSVESAFDLNVLQASDPSIMSQSSASIKNDQHLVGVRVARAFGPEGDRRAALFFRYCPNAVPESVFTPSNPDFDKFEVGGSARASLSQHLTLTAEYSHFFIPDRIILNSTYQPLAEPALATFNRPSPLGTYTGAGDRVMLGLTIFLDPPQ